eukprot:CAMPEP_0114557244 /NCGR_PEP_ID=MMETSP0114-20121206/9726_1 /TAXON_ID=31324 /ORGANISM="Goniomonas sp, Strain m" /LENGTH=496 /DNA_ID=CAMNT_0001742517 /DNA_START=18 /DNA_END=1505 /DNA_ORIENTATION=+
MSTLWDTLPVGNLSNIGNLSSTELFDLISVNICYLAGGCDVHLIAESLMVMIIFTLMFQKSYKPKRSADQLTDAEMDELVDEWQPEPLVPDASEGREPLVVSSMKAGTVCIEGKTLTNLGVLDFLGFLCDPKVNEACAASIVKYGNGSCGPRGFYGTLDVHLELEKKLSEFMGTEAGIVFSYDIATITSVIPAFAKRGDVVLYDSEVSQSILQGISLSRAVSKAFQHNDVSDLKRLMEWVRDQEKKTRTSNIARRFVVIEGIYQASGDLAPLAAVVALCKQFCYRLVLDETVSFGCLGANGKGATEYWGVPTTSVDILTATLSGALASVGGFCVGNTQVVEHQRLSATGYCFSAALPAFNAVAAITALEDMEADNGRVLRLQANATAFRDALLEQLARPESQRGQLLFVTGNEASPMLHLRLAEGRQTGNRDEDEEILHQITDRCRELGVAVTVTAYTPLQRTLPPPSIRVCVSASHTKEQLRAAAAAIVQAVTSV